MNDMKKEKRRKTKNNLNNFERLMASDSEINLWKSSSDEVMTVSQILTKNLTNIKTTK